VLKWTDASPIKNGSSISLRTNKTVVAFDDLKVYKFRAGNDQTITAGTAVTKDIRRRNGKVKSLVRDAAGNWSNPGNLDVTISSLTRQSNAIPNDTFISNKIVLYPNPTNGKHLTLIYEAANPSKTKISLLDYNGKLIKIIYDQPGKEVKKNVDISNLIKGIPAGTYFIKTENADHINTARIIKQ
ncbi:T9SS type A sorting domain-containing protein, partial [Aquimarina celericrescens]|nr:T9SS type A sorting domain-containing protein [Aquimarina celericrescens]